MAMGTLRHITWSNTLRASAASVTVPPSLITDVAFANINTYVDSRVFRERGDLWILDEPLLGEIDGNFYGVSPDCVQLVHLSEWTVAFVSEFKSGILAGQQAMQAWWEQTCHGNSIPYPDSDLSRDVFQVNLQLQALRGMSYRGKGLLVAADHHELIYGNRNGSRCKVYNGQQTYAWCTLTTRPCWQTPVNGTESWILWGSIQLIMRVASAIEQAGKDVGDAKVGRRHSYIETEKTIHVSFIVIPNPSDEF